MDFVFSLVLDLVLIALLITGIVHALKLSRQLQDLKASRTDMQKFVIDFIATVMRAEAGVRGLKQASRESGDDLEKLIEKGTLLRDELHFLVESADQVASRLSSLASTAARASTPEPAHAPKHAAPATKKPEPAPVAAKPAPTPAAPAHTTKHSHATAAERDLMRVLETPAPKTGGAP